MKKIGIFGGSFDPAHFGHLAISLFCLENLKLDEIKWVISKNPLKSKSRNSDSEKLKIAKSIAQFNKNINVSLSDKISAIDIIDEVCSFLRRNNCYYIWIMGLDSYLTLNLWKDYLNLISSIPMIVFNRAISRDLILNKEILGNLFEKNEIILKENNITFSEFQFPKLLSECTKNYGQKIYNINDLKFNSNYCKVYFVPKILSNLSSTTISN